MRHKLINALYILLVLLAQRAAAQKFMFVSYNVEQGLGQSQVTSLTQDSLGQLWISHLGGISRFDGRNFKTYTTVDGLQSNFCNAVLVDHTANIWIGTHIGFSVFDGKNSKTTS